MFISIRVIDEKCCGKISDDLGVIWMVRRGRHDLYDMIKMAKDDENMTTKILRILCWILLVAGELLYKDDVVSSRFYMVLLSNTHCSFCMLSLIGWMMIFSIFTTLLSTLPILGQLGNAAFFIVALIM